MLAEAEIDENNKTEASILSDSKAKETSTGNSNMPRSERLSPSTGSLSLTSK